MARAIAVLQPQLAGRLAPVLETETQPPRARRVRKRETALVLLSRAQRARTPEAIF